MRPQLKDYAYPAIKDFVRQKVEECGGKGVVIGLSGGIDSATVSKLCADAIGPEKVLNLFMPTRTSSKTDRKDAEDFCRQFGMELRVVDIEPARTGLPQHAAVHGQQGVRRERHGPLPDDRPLPPCPPDGPRRSWAPATRASC